MRILLRTLKTETSPRSNPYSLFRSPHPFHSLYFCSQSWFQHLIPLVHQMLARSNSNAKGEPFQGNHEICDSTTDLPFQSGCPIHFSA
eukprot:c51679_g1_i1 orf=204-467(+)